MVIFHRRGFKYASYLMLGLKKWMKKRLVDLEHNLERDLAIQDFRRISGFLSRFLANFGRFFWGYVMPMDVSHRQDSQWASMIY